MSLRGLYAITDEILSPDDTLIPHVEAVLKGGCRVLQYRNKHLDYPEKLSQARQIQRCCDAFGAKLFINDDAELARELGCHVHLGQDDMPIAEARRMVPAATLIGATCHDSLDLAEIAASAGADYLAFGSVYPSPTKPNAIRASLSLLQQAKRSFSLPIVAIGGITIDNCDAVIAAGADMVAVISNLFAAPDIEQRTLQFKQKFDSYN